MGRRRRRVVRVPRRNLPKSFSCPRCGKKAITVEIQRAEGKAIVSCGSCEVKEHFTIKPAHGPVDVYCMFSDKTYGKPSELMLD